MRLIEKVTVKDAPLSFVVKTRLAARDENPAKKQKLNDDDADPEERKQPEKTVQDVTTPLWKKKYKDQLGTKQQAILSTLGKIAFDTKCDSKTGAPNWIKNLFTQPALPPG